MEDGLVQCYLLNIYNILKLVLIFIVVEDGLVPIDYNGISDAYATS